MLGPDGFWTLWSVYPYLVIAPGLILLLLFATNIPTVTNLASKLAGPLVNTPLSQFQLSTVLCAFSLVFAYTSYAATGRNHERALDATEEGHHFAQTNFYLKMHFSEPSQPCPLLNPGAAVPRIR